MADEMTVNEQELVRHVETLQNKVEQLEGDLAMRDAETPPAVVNAPPA